jgi:hypothetical protein
MKKKGPTRDEVRRDRLARSHQIAQMQRATALREIATHRAQMTVPGLNEIQRRWLRTRIGEWTDEAKRLGASDQQIQEAMQVP